MSTNFYWIQQPEAVPSEEQIALGVLAGQERCPVHGPYDPEEYRDGICPTCWKSVAIDEPDVHIGKRSGAGLWCWKCNVTLCKSGIGMLHTGSEEWHEFCPRCSDAAPGAPGDEPASPDIRSSCSFTWAQQPKDVRGRCLADADRLLVVDEYGNLLSGAAFMTLLDECRVEITGLVGRWFS